MMDALEQFVSAPLVRVVKRMMKKASLSPTSIIGNKLIRQSDEWRRLGMDLTAAGHQLESDYGSFDLHRRYVNLMFALDVLLGRVKVRRKKEKSYLCFVRCILSKIFKNVILVARWGGVIDGLDFMPSGLSLTSDLDTILRSCYDIAVLTQLGVPEERIVGAINGDDSILGVPQLSKSVQSEYRRLSNKWFNAEMDRKDCLYYSGDVRVLCVQGTYPGAKDVAAGTTRLKRRTVWVEVDPRDIEIDAKNGKSHRIGYRWNRKPSFCQSYWDSNYQAIRKSKTMGKKLRHPEAVDKGVLAYVQRLLGSVVDNPNCLTWVNRAEQQLTIALQAQLASTCGLKAEMILHLTETRKNERDTLQFFPHVAGWRRSSAQKSHLDCEVGQYAHALVLRLVNWSRALGTRSNETGIAGWAVQEMFRGERPIPGDMWAAGFAGLEKLLKESPLSTAFKLRGIWRREDTPARCSKVNSKRFQSYRRDLFSRMKGSSFSQNHAYSRAVSNRLTARFRLNKSVGNK
jgi:hypothetical protein